MQEFFDIFHVELQHGQMLFMLFILILADFISGTLASRKLGKAIKSSGLHRTVTKIISYGLAFLVIISIKTMTSDLAGWNVIATTSLIFFLCNEGYSILENVHNLGIKLPSALVKLLKDKSEDNNS